MPLVRNTIARCPRTLTRSISVSCVRRSHDPFGYTPAVKRNQAAQFIYSLCLVRHGDRTPKQSYPNLKLSEAGEASHAQLTELGREQMVSLGKQYREFFDRRGIPVTPEQVFVRSTASARCRDSADYFVAGMFGNPAAVPVYSLPLDLDTLLKRHRHNDFEAIKDRIYLSPEWRQQQDLYEADLALLSDICGKPIALKDVNHVQAFFRYMITHKIPLPTVLTPDVLHAADEMGELVCQAVYQLSHVITGPSPEVPSSRRVCSCRHKLGEGHYAAFRTGGTC